MVSVVLHAILLAFGLILPLGVQNIFVFQQGALHKSYMRVVPVVVTAALCDTLLIVLAVSGVSVLVFAHAWLTTGLMIFGACFLLYMGLMTWRSRPQPAGETEVVYSVKKQIIFAISVSLLNPHAILDTIGVIGTSSVAYEGNERIAFMLSCVAVSWLWFASLALAGKWLGKIDSSDNKLMVIINKCSAVLIWAVALLLIRNVWGI
ncbi:MAG: LysE/ArgO family amino acid transporter [Gorillibacterium sp.]|nr:LysE/ArgO family amino acid transporter [Gorillibacterium sp.]